ncbi:hypothetical protein CVT26_007385 [Gymnopilus dilepis]|uniref:Uncharacterized protein n=1 Tax=Gymnopilus dilepis TaxID=231916 RepID=A0A409X0Q6_9AGAR|nr:hypothetical protein CVT26_007385 [Gymnopilus dilepis]
MSRIWNRLLESVTPTASQQTIGSNSHNSPKAAFISSNSSGLTSATPPAATHTAPPRDMPTPTKARPISGDDSALTTNNETQVESSASTSRARSEPLPPKDDDGDVEMDSCKPLSCARSEYVVGIPEATPDTTDGADSAGTTDPIEEEEEEEASQSLFNARRAPSPALTEADNQDPQYIFGRLDVLRVRRRDYAFAQPYASKLDPEVFQGDYAEEHAPQKPIEVFDQYKALTEVDYRFTQPVRTYPISGKTLHHLLEMGWLSREDLDMRGHPMDFEELEDFLSRPIYPWKPFKSRCTPDAKPSEGERRDLLTARRGFWMQYDKMRMFHERLTKMREEEEKQATAMLTEEDRIRIGKGKARDLSPSSNGTKRPHEEDFPSSFKTPITAPHSHYTSHFPVPKRRRITPERALAEADPLRPTNPALDPHRQQIMPSVPRPNGVRQPRPGERADTPPVDEDGSSQQSQSPQRGQKLVHPRAQKAMRRALGRTQTLQL